MADNIEYVPALPNRGMTAKIDGRLFSAFPITMMKSGEGHNDPAAAITNELNSMISSRWAKQFSTIHLFFVVDQIEPATELSNGIKVEYRGDIAYAELTFGVLAEQAKGGIMTTNDGDNWVPADSRPAGE